MRSLSIHLVKVQLDANSSAGPLASSNNSFAAAKPASYAKYTTKEDWHWQRHRKMERIRSRIVEEIVSAVLTVIYHISCVFLFVPRAAFSLAQRLYISFFGINLKDKVMIMTNE